MARSPFAERMPDNEMRRDSSPERVKDSVAKQASAVADEALKTAKAATREIGQAGSEIGEAATAAAKAAAGAVSAQASELISNVADELTTSAEQQKERGADTMRGFAKAIHMAADDLRQQSPQIARHFHGAAEGVEKLSDNIRDKSVRELFDTASSYARQQPTLFFAGAVVAGFALARFLKSTSTRAVAQPATGAAPQGQPFAAGPMNYAGPAE